MIGVIFRLTLGQLLRQRRALLLLLLAGIPIGITLLYRFASSDGESELPEFVANTMDNFIVSLGLPLTALIIGTGALGQEIEDGTVLYLLSKPIARWKVIVAKVLAAWLLTSALMAVAVMGTGAPLFAHAGHDMLVPAFLVATVVGSLAYTALFVSLSIRFGHALVIGLAYVFVWEAGASGFIEGVRFLSLRAYTQGIADALTNAPPDVFEARLGAAPAAILTGIVVVVAVWYAMRCLRRFEFSERA